MMHEDHEKSKIWELAKCMAEEREFILSQMGEAQKMYERQKKAVAKKESHGQLGLKTPDDVIVVEFITWARDKAKQIKNPQQKLTQMLKSALYKDSLLNARHTRMENAIRSQGGKQNGYGGSSQPIAKYKANREGTEVVNIARPNARSRAMEFLEQYKQNEFGGKEITDKGDKAGKNVATALKDILNERGICRNCASSGKSFKAAGTHRLPVCGLKCNILCTICFQGKHWHKDCPKNKEKTEKEKKTSTKNEKRQRSVSVSKSRARTKKDDDKRRTKRNQKKRF